MMEQRLDGVLNVSERWRSGDIGGALKWVTSSRNPGLLNDVLRHVVVSCDNITLDHALILLPAVAEMLSSQVDEYAATAVKALRLLFDGYSELIATTRRAAGSMSGGTDVAREERMRRCLLASDILLAMLPSVQHLSLRPGALGWHAADMRASLERFAFAALP